MWGACVGVYQLLNISWSSGFRPNVLGKISYVVKSPGVDAGFVGPEAYTSFGALLKKRMQNYNYNIRYESEYLFRAPPRAVHASKESWSWSFVSFAINPPLEEPLLIPSSVLLLEGRLLFIILLCLLFLFASAAWEVAVLRMSAGQMLMWGSPLPFPPSLLTPVMEQPPCGCIVEVCFMFSLILLCWGGVGVL